MTHILTKLTHLRIASSIVGNRSIGISGKGDSQCGEHSYGSDTDAIESVGKTAGTHAQVETVGAQIAQHDGNTDGEYGDTGRYHTRTDTLDNHGGRACQSSL